jgi:hypothetical protein
MEAPGVIRTNRGLWIAMPRREARRDYGEYRSRFSARCSLSQPSLTCPALMFRDEEARFHATPTPNSPAMTSANQTAMNPVSKAT